MSNVHQSRRNYTSRSCTLHAEERITNVKLYKDLNENQYDYIVGMEINTSQKSCGLFGKSSAQWLEASGHQLLYITGWTNSYVIELISLHFDYGCNSTFTSVGTSNTKDHITSVGTSTDPEDHASSVDSFTNAEDHASSGHRRLFTDPEDHAVVDSFTDQEDPTSSVDTFTNREV